MAGGLIGCERAIHSTRPSAFTSPLVGVTPIMAVPPELLHVLRATGEAPVIVALVDPPTHPDPALDSLQRRIAIARVQARVLARLGASDYRVGELFTSVPAMSGTVLSERGARRLAAHPSVRRVDLDVGGGGATTG